MKRAFAIGALIAATAAFSAGAQTIRGNTENSDRDEVVVAVGCGDLRAEVAAARPECQAERPASRPAVRLTAFEQDRPAAKQRRMTALPWLIGVYN
ncbi:MAG: hypothetical protein IH625_00140 [Rhodobacteraceae bacterium]|nr:hypothetical protein [Paracoccaceae bacterium]